MDRGEVRWYHFSAPNKKRPVVILTRQAAISYLGEITVAQITTTVRNVPSQVRLDLEDGMSQVCAVNLFQMNTVPKQSIGAKITRLSESRMVQIDRAIEFALELSAPDFDVEHG